MSLFSRHGVGKNVVEGAHSRRTARRMSKTQAWRNKRETPSRSATTSSVDVDERREENIFVRIGRARLELIDDSPAEWVWATCRLAWLRWGEEVGGDSGYRFPKLGREER